MKLNTENRKFQAIRANMFYFGLLSLVLAIIWVGTSVYFQFNKTTTDTEIEKLVKPIRPSLEIDSVQEYSSSRINLPDQFLITATKTDGKVSKVEIINPFGESNMVNTSISSSSSSIVSRNTGSSE